MNTRLARRACALGLAVLLLTAAGALLLYNHIRRRKEETISS